MAPEVNQYLRLQMGGATFLLPSVLRYTIEQRDGLTLNPDSRGRVAAWRTVRTGRWPAYALDSGLRPTRPTAPWQRAVFLEGTAGTIGIIVEDVQLMARGAVNAAPFAPLGPPPTRYGHLFTGAWVDGAQLLLIFDPQVLIGYLQTLGE